MGMSMRMFRTWVLMLAASLASSVAPAAPLTRQQALAAIDHPQASTRRAGVARLVEIGAMADADRLHRRLWDPDPQVRSDADAALWKIWSRSGDPAIDKLFWHGIGQMQASRLDDALAAFNEVLRRKPEFAEGWHKRAIVHFLQGQHDQALADCDEALKRNRSHFGALSGAGQIHLRLGHAQRALEFFRRAVAINPNLQGPARLIPRLEEHVRDLHRQMI